MLVEKMEIVRQIFHGFNYQPFFTGGTSQRLSTILRAEEFSWNKTQEQTVKIALSKNPPQCHGC